jgi:hypothetical protein
MKLNYLTPLLFCAGTFCQPPAIKNHDSSAYMIIDPKIMSQDVIEAFDFLTEKKKSIEVILKNDEALSQIIAVRALNGGYLMLFTIKSLKGDQYKIVPLTDIVSIESL